MYMTGDYVHVSARKAGMLLADSIWTNRLEGFVCKLSYHAAACLIAITQLVKPWCHHVGSLVDLAQSTGHNAA